MKALALALLLAAGCATEAKYADYDRAWCEAMGGQVQSITEWRSARGGWLLRTTYCWLR